MDWQGADVVYKDSRKNNRLFLEAWANDEDSINRCINLNPAYEGARERQAQERTATRAGMERRGMLVPNDLPQGTELKQYVT